MVIPRGNGPHTCLAVKFPLRDEAGRTIGLGGIMTDVTRLKQAEQQTREAVQQRGRFLGMLSHEFRNPLGAIANATQVMERSPAGASAQGDALRVVHRQAMQMSRLLDDLLDIARITQGKIQLQRVATPLNPLVAEAAEVARPAFEEADGRLETRAPDGPVWVTGDPARLRLLLVNLLMNGAKYTPPTGVVRLELAAEGEEAVVRVRDNGVGIRSDMLEREFDLFVQADESLHRTSSGLGVGLTLVRAIAEMHGGRARAYSAGPGLGSEFVVRLPLARAAATTAEDPPEAAPAGPPLRIVVIEDNADGRRMLETMLKLDGHAVRAAADGEEGLRAVANDPPEVPSWTSASPPWTGTRWRGASGAATGTEVSTWSP